MRNLLIGLGLYAGLMNGAYALNRVEVVDACRDELITEFGSQFEDYYGVGATGYVEFKTSPDGLEYAQLLTGHIFCWVSEGQISGDISASIVILP